MDHLNDVIASVCPDSQIAASIQCKRTKATSQPSMLSEHTSINLFPKPYEILHFLSSSTKQQIQQQLRKCVLSLVIIMIKLVKLKVDFLGLQVPQANAETLFQSLTNHCEQFNVPFTNIIGYSADEANTMMGCNSSGKNQNVDC